MFVVVVSTTGDGEPPDTVTKFWRRLKKKTLPRDHLSQCKYALLGKKYKLCIVVNDGNLPQVLCLPWNKLLRKLCFNDMHMQVWGTQITPTFVTWARC